MLSGLGRALKIVVMTLLAASCSPVGSSGGDELPDEIDDAKADLLGLVDMGPIPFGTPVNATLGTGQLQGWRVAVKPGGNITIAMNKAMGSALNPMVYLYSPPSGSSRRHQLKRDDNGGGDQNALISSFACNDAGEYLIVATSARRQSGGAYTLALTCNNNACLPDPTLTFATSRIAQVDIDAGRFTPEQLFKIGDFLFDHNYTVEEGWGNALAGPQPNLRKVHKGKFGGPDSQNCARCHTVGGTDGGGRLEDNMFQDGDGSTEASALVRNPRALLGVGYLQQLALEMTQDLQRQQSSLGCGGSVQLTSKGVRFGTLSRRSSDCSFDFSQVQGLDNDLVVKPLGWKGRVATLRRFVEGGFQVHLGMQTQPLIARNCPTQSPNDTGTIPEIVGNGPNCLDPDRDGVFDEITEGQLTAMAVYVALQQAPVRIDPTTPDGVARVRRGEQLFSQAGCAGCHMPVLTLNSSLHAEVSDSTGRPFNFDLSVDVHEPRLELDPDGTIAVELFSDLKRHEMGASLADSHPTFGTISASQFMTPPLWGVASTPPYMHDGRAPRLIDAVLAHDGEASDAKARFQALPLDDQNKLIEFLGTLSRDPAHAAD